MFPYTDTTLNIKELLLYPREIRAEVCRHTMDNSHAFIEAVANEICAVYDMTPTDVTFSITLEEPEVYVYEVIISIIRRKKSVTPLTDAEIERLTEIARKHNEMLEERRHARDNEWADTELDKEGRAK